MNTTINEHANNDEPLARDDKAMKDAYGKGETINSLADSYGLTSAEVESIVVTEVKDNAPLPTQAELDAKSTKSKE